jgi:glycosyl transferase, family 25
MKLIISGLIIAIILVLCLIVYNRENFNELKNLNGINSFENYFYINLEHRTDRKKQITGELKKMKIPEDKIIRIDAFRNKYNGHIGCCKSHIKTIELAKKMNLNNAIVFEDDFVFTLPKNEVDKKINHFFKSYPNYDIIQLTSSTISLKNINDNHIKKVNKASTASAYIINKKFFNRFLEDLMAAKNKMETEMKKYEKNKKITCTKYALDQHWNILQKKSNWYIFYPYIGTQGGDAWKSSIGKCNNKI